jgi:hypothetical protein
MTRFLLAAGVAALAIASPAAADPGKNENGRGGARAERTKSFQGERAKGNRQAVERAGKAREQRAERAKKPREQSFERGKRVAEARAKTSERRIERSKKAIEQRAESGRKVLERRDKAQRQLVERRQALANREFKDREQLLKERSRQLEKVAERRRDDIRIRDFDDDDRWAVLGRGRALIDGCPPGLARQNELCMPPGQYTKRMMGQVLPAAYRDKALPLSLRSIYRDTDDYYWRYGDNGYLYRVDRDRNLIDALLPLIGAGYGVGQAFPTTYMNNYVPDYYRAFYPDTPDDYYRYANGYVYEIDRDSGMIEDLIPMYGNGYGVGQMLPASYSYYNLPYQYRDWYQDDDEYYYRYAPGAIYQVDRGSNLITSIASLLAGDLGVGSRLPVGYDVYNVPLSYRDRYYDTADNWYRYNDGYIYQVDPTTRLITAAIQAIT